MKKLLQRWLGHDRRIQDLEQRLAKAKNESVKLREERNELRETLAKTKPWLNTELSRMLEAAPHVQLDLELLRELAGRDAMVSFSQCGEDRVVASHLAQLPEKGIVVDIGAYHPFRFSNTFLFHLMGWKCVSVDANPESVALLEKVRPTDTNVCALVSDRQETLKYFSFAEGAWNTTREGAVSLLEGREQGGTKLVAASELEAVPIMELLDRTVGGNNIDLLDIDVEGMDTRLLLGIDFSRHAPAVILVEIQPQELEKPEIKDHLASGGYRLAGRCGHTALLVRDGR